MSRNSKNSKPKVFILAFAGTEAGMETVWRKRLKDGRFKILTVDEGYNLLDVLAEAVADNDLDDNFILVPANTIPARTISMSMLRVPVVYVTAKGEKVFASRVPVALSKADIVEALCGISAPSASNAEKVMAALVGKTASFRLAVGHSFGNYIGQVISPAPCENKVIEHLVTKLFVSSSAVGWQTVYRIVQESLSQENE